MQQIRSEFETYWKAYTEMPFLPVKSSGADAYSSKPGRYARSITRIFSSKWLRHRP